MFAAFKQEWEIVRLAEVSISKEGVWSGFQRLLPSLSEAPLTAMSNFTEKSPPNSQSADHHIRKNQKL